MNKLLEARACSLAAWHCVPPAAYHHLLSPDPLVARDAHNLAVKHFRIILAAESAENGGADVRPLASIFWRKSPFVRCLLMAFEQDELQKNFRTAKSLAMKLQLNVAKNLGDSRVVENIHQHGRDLFRASKAQSFSNTRIFANALKSQALEQRKVPCVGASAADKAMATPWQGRWRESLINKLTSKGHKLPEQVQLMMAPKTAAHTWPSPAPASLFQQAAASQWLFSYWEDTTLSSTVDVNASWLSVLARPGEIVAQESTSRLVKVLASSEYAFLGMDVVVENGTYILKTERCNVAWHHIVDLDDWLEVEAEPVMLGARGPIGWKPGHLTMQLHTAALVHGLALTFVQMKDLIKYLGGALPKGKLSKKAVHEQLIDMAVPDNWKELARKHLAPGEGGGPDEDGFDSDLSEVVSELAQDDMNQQDLKEYKQKKRTRKLKRKLNQADGPVQPKARAKGKAKAKGQGKGKKGKGKKGHGKKREKAKGLLATLVRRACELRELEVKKAQEEAQQANMDIDPAKASVDVNEEEGEAAPPPHHDPAPEDALPQPPPPPEDAAPEEADSALPPPPPEDAAPEEADSALPPPPPEDGEPEEADSAKRPRLGSKKIHKSPEEIFDMISPPGCKMALSFVDHRFSSRFPADERGLPGEFKSKFFTRAFAARRTWKQALAEVHEHCWRKWQLVKATNPLIGGQVEQVPGEIPEEVIELLVPF